MPVRHCNRERLGQAVVSLRAADRRRLHSSAPAVPAILATILRIDGHVKPDFTRGGQRGMGFEP